MTFTLTELHDEASTDEYSAVPEALRSTDRWIVYRVEERNGNETKVPYSAEWGHTSDGGIYNASTTKPDSWASFETARSFYQNNDMSGLGFVFSDDDDIMGIDLDHILDEDGSLTRTARTIVESADSYTERSPSGDGLHVLGRGDLSDTYQNRCDEVGLEMYETERFFTVTGDVFEGRDSFDSMPAREIQMTYLDEVPTSSDEQDSINVDFSSSHDYEFDSVTPQDVIDKARACSDKFDTLYNGGSIHGNTSSDDFSFLLQLAFWTKEDPRLMDACFRDSGRMRAKWDEQRGSQTYGELSIQNAIAENDETFSGSY